MTEPCADLEPSLKAFPPSCEIELRACSRDLSALLNLAHDLGAETDSASLLRKALQHAVQLLGFEGGFIWQTNPGTPTLHLVATVSLPPSLLATTPAELDIGVGASGGLLAVREPVLMSIEDWSGPEVLGRTLRAAGVQTVLRIPLLAHGHVMGAMVLITTRRLSGLRPENDLAATLGTVVGVALAHAREQAALIQEERLAAVGRMAAGVAHELKTPLTVFLGRTELLRINAQASPSVASDEVARSATALQEAAQRMKRIVDSLSLYSKPPKAELESVDVCPLLTAIHEMLQSSARNRSVTLRVDAPTSAGLHLRGDRSHLLQVLLNLATNAIEAVAGGGIVTLSARPGEGSEIILEVVDNGPGIPSEAQARIWEPFFTTKAEGTGLGLPIVRSLVKRMGGTIRVESSSGHGTLFRMSFPKASEA